MFITTRGYVFQFDLTGWGWVTLILGAVAVVVSMGPFQSADWALISGIVIAGLIVIANFLSCPTHLMVHSGDHVLQGRHLGLVRSAARRASPAPGHTARQLMTFASSSWRGCKGGGLMRQTSRRCVNHQ